MILRLALLACITFASIPTSPATAADDARPNIVLIMLDDLGFADLGCYGATIIQTPTFDRLAANGLRFTQFYNTAKCHSSRICLLTGLYPFQAGNEAMDRGVTIAEAVRPAGYFTAMTGKWHLAGEPTERGFDRYFGHLSGATDFFKGDNTFRLNGKPWKGFDKDFYTTDANTDYAMRFVDEARAANKPFFLYIAHNAPHYPLQAPAEDIDKYRGKFAIGFDRLRSDRYAKQLELRLIDKKHALPPRPVEVDPWDTLSEDWRKWESHRMAVFAAMVDRVDQNVARLVAHLKKHGQWDNTLFMLCADNGACPFDRTRGREKSPSTSASYWCYDVGWAHAGNTPFRWYKQNQHEGGISSPLIVHWPAGLKTKPGSITDQPGHLIDLLPTIAEVAGAKYPTQHNGRAVTPVQGKSLLPILRSEQREPHDLMYFQFSNNRAIRQGDWKLVSARGGRWELYDIATDRTELRDLASKHPERVQRMAKQWFEFAEHVDRAPKNLRKPVGKQLVRYPAKLTSQRVYVDQAPPGETP